MSQTRNMVPKSRWLKSAILFMSAVSFVTTGPINADILPYGADCYETDIGVDLGGCVSSSNTVTAGNSKFGAIEFNNDGGTFTFTTDRVVAAANPSSKGFVIVRGVTLTATELTSLSIGNSGIGVLTIEGKDGDNGIVNSADGVQIGGLQGSSGLVTVLDGGELHVGTLQGNGTALIVGQGHVPGGGGPTTPGLPSFGALNILSGGTVTATRIRVGGSTNSSGKVRVTGANAKLTVAGVGRFQHVGERGHGSLIVENGGTAELNKIVNIGSNPGVSGSVLVDGPSSFLKVYGLSDFNGISTRLAVGRAGSGTLKITKGGTVLVDPETVSPDPRYSEVTVGGRGGTTVPGEGERSGFLLVNGAGSLLKVDNYKQTMRIGRNAGGSGVMHVTAGGAVEMTNVDGLSVGGIATEGSSGSVLIDGVADVGGTPEPSLWDSGRLLGCAKDFDRSTTVPLNETNLTDSGGKGTLAVRNGGVVSAEIIVIGSGCALLGDGTVDAGILINEGTILPGNSPGTLTVTNNVQHKGSLVMEVLGTAPGQFDVLKAGGTVTFEPGSTINIVTRGNTLSEGIAVIVEASEIQGDVSVSLDGGPATEVDAFSGSGIAVVVNSAGAAQIVAVGAATPVSLLNSLIAKVVGLNFKHGLENSLDAKLDTATNALADLNANNNGAAIGAMGAFIIHVQAQAGKAISNEDAEALVLDAQAIIDLIG